MSQFLSRPNNPGLPGDVRRPVLGIVGAGRVGQALAHTLWTRGYTITAVYSRSPDSAARLAAKVDAQTVNTADQVANRAQLILLTVPDDAIRLVCEQLAVNDLTDRAVVHTSGATPLNDLQAAKRRGALIGGLHPIAPIRSGSIPAGVTFGVEADREPLRGWLAALVDTLEGVTLWLRPGIDRARYHAAAVLVSNYVVTLLAESTALLSRFTVDETVAQAALITLAQITLENVQQAGLVAALTGPIVRGDVQTVQAHLSALHPLDPELSELYRLLGRRTLRLAAARGMDAEQLAALQEALQNHAYNDLGHSEDEAQRTAHPDGDSL